MEFLEVRSTEGQKLLLRKDAIRVFEVVQGSSRVEGHVNVYLEGFKFMVAMQKEDLLSLLGARIEESKENPEADE